MLSTFCGLFLLVQASATGAVSGRIIDAQGQPATDVPVQLVRTQLDLQGRTFRAAGSTNADDRGDYRLYGVSPGTYYLLVGNSPGPVGRPGRPGSASAGVYALSFYPGVADFNQAAPIEVKSGSEVIADVRVQRENTYRIRGRVIDSRTGQAPPRVDVSLNYRTLTGSGGSFASGQNYNPKTGTFELRDIVPGHYIVQALMPEPDRPLAVVPVDVQSSDVDGVVLTLTLPASLSIRLSLEGGAFSTLAGRDRISVEIRPTDGIVFPPALVPVGADGTLRIDNFRQGNYQIRVANLPQGVYAKSAVIGGVDVLTDVFRFSGSTSATMDIVLSARAAQLTGGVLDGANRPAAGVLAILVPMQRNRTDLFRFAVTDPNGRFGMTGITPGDYKLFGWNGHEPYRFQDPNFISKFETDGTPVHVDESSTQAIQVRMIPVP